MDGIAEAKQYLNQVLVESQDLQKMMESITEKRERMLYPKIFNDNTKVMTGQNSSSFEGRLASLLDLEEKYNERVLAYEFFRDRVLDQLLGLPDEASEDILYLIYFKGMLLQDAAKRLKYNRCYMSRLYKTALQQFYDMHLRKAGQ